MRNLLASRVNVNVYITIRFSLRFERYMKVAFGEEARRADWFAMRAQLFKASIVACMEQQTVPPRAVFVLMDTEDQDLWHQHLDLPAPYVPLFVSGSGASAAVAARITADRAKNVVLSRLDSDDAISARYLEKTTELARELWRQGKSKAYMVACDGYVTNLDKIQQIYYNCSPFISLYARRYNGENIYDVEHQNILERDPYMLRNATWMQIVHGSNIANRTYTKSRYEPDDARKMTVGELTPIKSAWPQGFPLNLAVEAKTVQEAWKKRSAPNSSNLTSWADALDDDGPEALEADPGEWEVVTQSDGTLTTTAPNASSEAQAEAWRLRNGLPSGSPRAR
jgi:hypothetical protein